MDGITYKILLGEQGVFEGRPIHLRVRSLGDCESGDTNEEGLM
jgi:hypothetical protein